MRKGSDALTLAIRWSNIDMITELISNYGFELRVGIYKRNHIGK